MDNNSSSAAGTSPAATTETELEILKIKSSIYDDVVTIGRLQQQIAQIEKSIAERERLIGQLWAGTPVGE